MEFAVRSNLLLCASEPLRLCAFAPLCLCASVPLRLGVRSVELRLMMVVLQMGRQLIAAGFQERNQIDDLLLRQNIG